jgi:hypothetical protein
MTIPKFTKKFLFLDIASETRCVENVVIEVNIFNLLWLRILNKKNVVYSALFAEHLTPGKKYAVLEHKFIFNYEKL